MAKKKRRINVRLLRRIQKHILEEPKRLDMGRWCRKKEWDGFQLFPEVFPECGMQACIGGWAIVLSGGRINRGFSPLNMEDRAAKLLGLDEGQSSRLFFAREWPVRLIPRPRNAEATRCQIMRDAKKAVERIDIFIESKGKI